MSKMLTATNDHILACGMGFLNKLNYFRQIYDSLDYLYYLVLYSSCIISTEKIKRNTLQKGNYIIRKQEKSTGGV